VGSGDTEKEWEVYTHAMAAQVREREEHRRPEIGQETESGLELT
jgi:hypothetical protein